MNKITTTLLFIIKDNKILLAEKLRGHGKGFFNGVGGKKQENESIIDCLLRETKEEINVSPKGYTEVAIIDFELYYKGEYTFENMHVFIAADYEGTLSSSDEMRPSWFDIDKIPYEQMFADDLIWLPKVLEGKKTSGFVKLDKDFNVVEQQLKFLDNLENSKSYT